MNKEQRDSYLARYKKAKEAGVPFFPDIIFKDALVSLLVLAAFALIRTFRKATGQKLLLDDAAYQNVVETLKKLIDPQTPKNPNANP